MSGSTSDRETAVRLHAVEQLRARRPVVYGDLTDAQVSRSIRLEVRAAIEAGRISHEKPVGFRLHREKQAPLERSRKRYVWTASGELGWVIARESGTDVVLTTLTRARAA